jgi:hypothetical protein
MQNYKNQIKVTKFIPVAGINFKVEMTFNENGITSPKIDAEICKKLNIKNYKITSITTNCELSHTLRDPKTINSIYEKIEEVVSWNAEKWFTAQLAPDNFNQTIISTIGEVCQTPDGRLHDMLLFDQMENQ